MKLPPDEHCKLLTTTARAAYNVVKKVFCPILNKEVVFNSKGFHHLQYKPDGTSRTTAEKIYKLTLLPLAVPVITNAIGINEERNIKLRYGRKKESKIVNAKQYALVAMVGKKNPIEVRVIILDIENSQNPIFWSIMKH